jgi:hypothetical protein
MTAACTVEKAHLVQQQNGMNESHTADVATSPTVICRLIQQPLLCVNVCPTVRRRSSDSYLFSIEKALCVHRTIEQYIHHKDAILSRMHSAHIVKKN